MKLSHILTAVMSGNFKGHFGQYAEDTLVRKIFSPRKRMGTCLDLGAYHPFKFNNTAYFWMCGWRCVNVDANPRTIELFNKKRPTDTNVHAAVISQAEIAAGIREITLSLPDGDDKGGVSALGTVDVKQATANKMVRNITVPTMGVAEILEKYELQDVAYINVDIEGYDDKIMLDIDFDRYRPEVVSVEQFADDVADVVHGEVAMRMREYGYSFHSRASFTSIYIRRN